MKSEIFADHNLKAKIFWGAILALSVAVCGAMFFELFAFTAQQVVILTVSLTVSALVNQYQIRVPRTQIKFSAKELTFFWGTVWLGLPGAVLMAASASLTRYNFAEKDRFKWLFSVFNNICAAFVSAKVFYFALFYFSGFSAKAVADNPVALQWLAPAAGLMALTHYFLTVFLNAIFVLFDSQSANSGLWKASVLRNFAPYLLNFGTVFLLHFLFLEFGLAFGWVILAIAAVGHLAYRLHNERLEQKVKEIREASRIHLATVEALATAIDARDQVGRGHVRRTQIYAVGIGEMLGLPADEIQALETGALLHDIGKLAVPDHILNKPGRLTPAEMEKIKIHAAVGASILEKIGFNYPVLPTIKYHHESWDGSGYPEGLKGKKIPLTARILSVADAYDTLRGARPYRPAVAREEARKFLINGAGTQFDLTIVDIFLRNLTAFEARIEAEGLAYDIDGVPDANTVIQPVEENTKNYIEQIKRANREVFTLYELAKTFSSSLSPETIYPLFTEKIRELVPFDTCVIYLLNEITDEARAVYTEGKNDSALKDIYVKSGEGGTGFALKKRQAVSSNVPNLDFSFSQVELNHEYSAMASLPLIAKEKLLGAVSIYSCSLAEYEDEHLRLLETVSRIASDAILKSISHAENESRALTDPMTSLPNARSLQIHFDKESARADRTSNKFQVLMLDLDGFKAINDTFGHKVGDRLLKELSKVMRGQLRDYDFLARYAGDEFAAIIPETDDRSVQELCRRIEKAVADFVLPIGDGRFARVGISVGAASYPKNGEILDQLLISADEAMYQVKMQRKQAHLQAENKKNSESKPPVPTPPSVQSEPIQVKKIETVRLNPEDVIIENTDENFLVELDESHIISTAIN